jgi:hypothetical protein
MQVVTQPSEDQDQCCHLHMYLFGCFAACIAQQSCTNAFQSLFMTTHRSKKILPVKLFIFAFIIMQSVSIIFIPVVDSDIFHSSCGRSNKIGQSRSVAYPGILFGGCSTNSGEDRGQRERGSGGSSPVVRGSGGSCNFIQKIAFHIVKFS